MLTYIAYITSQKGKDSQCSGLPVQICFLSATSTPSFKKPNQEMKQAREPAEQILNFIIEHCCFLFG